MSRRTTTHLRLVGSDATLLLVAAAAGADKAAELDGELLAYCAEAHTAGREAGAAMDRAEAMDPDDSSMNAALAEALPLFTAYNDAVERAAQLQARTPEGIRAKAALLLLHIDAECDHAGLATSLARDVAGRGGA